MPHWPWHKVNPMIVHNDAVCIMVDTDFSNGLQPVQCHANHENNADVLFTRPLGTELSERWITINMINENV